MDKKQEVKDLLKELKRDGSPELKEKGKSLLKGISASDLAMIEQEIINEGVTRKDMRKLCSVHLEVMKDELKKEIKLEEDHPIRTMMEEHRKILGFLEELKEVILNEDFVEENVNLDFDRLEKLARGLVNADSHHEREEKILFVEVEARGIIEPPMIMKEEHEEIKPKKKELLRLIKDYKKNSNGRLLLKIKETFEFIYSELQGHIYKEDNILYPMALEVIEKEKWDSIKKRCDKIGYSL